MKYELVDKSDVGAHLGYDDVFFDVSGLSWEPERMVLSVLSESDSRIGMKVPVSWVIITNGVTGNVIEECYMFDGDLILVGGNDYILNGLFAELDRTIYHMLQEKASPEQITGYLNL